MSTAKELPYLKNTINKDDIAKLQKVFKTLEDDSQAFDFLEPVNYIELGLTDYPTIVEHPMDLGTVKQNLLDGKYETFKEFLTDIDLIWSNCRLYNMPQSNIVKMANHCEKVFKKQMDKNFKNYTSKAVSKQESEAVNVPVNNESELSTEQKMNLTEKIKNLNNDGIAKVVNFIKKDCPKGIEDINEEKLQIKLDFIDLKTYNSLISLIENNFKKTAPSNEPKDASPKDETAKEENA